MKREKLASKGEAKVKGGGNYFATPKSDLDFIGSGCTTLDLALGGGWAERRVFNIVGDKSTGKTLLCIEAAANFAAKYPDGYIRYAEAESAFDKKYAEALGMPVDRVDFGDPLETVEDLFEELNAICDEQPQPKVKKIGGEEVLDFSKVPPVLYIIDSLDALSDRSEMSRDLDEGTYGANKAKQMSQLFRRLTQKMAKTNVTFGVISQVRDNIGITFGRKTTRSGGRALDFYASQVLYLAYLGTSDSKTVKGIKRPIGIKVRAKVDKNKVSLPFREAQFEIAFGYGVDDYKACLDWLDSCGSLSLAGVAKVDIKKQAKAMMRTDPKEFRAEMEKVRAIVEDKWYEIETAFLPTRKKYA